MKLARKKIEVSQRLHRNAFSWQNEAMPGHIHRTHASHGRHTINTTISLEIIFIAQPQKKEKNRKKETNKQLNRKAIHHHSHIAPKNKYTNKQ